MSLTLHGRRKGMRTGVISGNIYLALHRADNAELVGHGYARKQLDIASARFNSDGSVTFTNIDIYTAADMDAQDADKVSLYDAANAGNQLVTTENFTVDVAAPDNGQTLRLTTVVFSAGTSLNSTAAGKVKAMREGLISGNIYLSLHLANNNELVGHGYSRVQLDINDAAFNPDGTVTFTNLDVYTAADGSAQDADKASLWNAESSGNRLLSVQDLSVDQPAPANGQTFRLTAITFRP